MLTPCRYLSKIADQTVALIANEHARDLILVDTDGPSDSVLEASDDEDSEDENDDRLFTFEVTKTREEEENVTVSPGFEVCFPTRPTAAAFNLLSTDTQLASQSSSYARRCPRGTIAAQTSAHRWRNQYWISHCRLREGSANKQDEKRRFLATPAH